MTVVAVVRTRWRQVGVAVAAVAVALVVMAVLLRYGGGVARESLPGLPDAGVAGWALPAARLAGQAAAVATVGWLFAALVLSPRDAGRLSGVAYRRLRAARWPALVWSVCAAGQVWLTLADLLAVSPVDVSMAMVVNVVVTVPVGRALALVAALTVIVAVGCTVSLGVRGAAVTLAVAVLAVLPPAFAGHAAAGGNHQIAVSALLAHVVAVTVWAGGVLALLLSGRAPTSQTAVAVRRFSPVAAGCLLVVAVSGLVSAAVRLPDPQALVTTRYGQLMVVKTIALVGIAALGWLHRTRALPALRTGDRRRFTAVAAGEVLAFAATLGAAVALSRTPPPVTSPVEESRAASLLGYEMPGPMTARTLTGDWLIEPLYLSIALAAAAVYVCGVLRLRRRGDQWPASRTAALLGGCALLIVATSSGLARYAPVLFSVHMGQHLLLNMVVPILLVLSAPVTLALRALRPCTDPAWPGPREIIAQALHSPALRLVSHPLVALVLYVGGLYAMYFTGLYELSLRSHAAHLVMIGHFLATGYLFFWVVVGLDPAPRRVGHPLRMVLVLTAMVLHAFVGVTLMMSRTVLAETWFAALDRPWGPDSLTDQHTGGGLAWSFGEIPMAVVVIMVFLQWIRADEREARRRDRAADRAAAHGEPDEELAAYNAMLADLAARDGRTRDAHPDRHATP